MFEPAFLGFMDVNARVAWTKPGNPEALVARRRSVHNFDQVPNPITIGREKRLNYDFMNNFWDATNTITRNL